MSDKPKAGFFRYLKEAFAFRWNLLLFGGATAAAALSGHFDIAMPLIAAAEVTYLAGLASLPRFQAAIDARSRAEQRQSSGTQSSSSPQAQSGDAKERLLQVMRSLSDERRNRFLRLRARCAEMQRIANAVRGDTQDPSGAVKELRTPALDRLLWVFLRLLLSQQAVQRFVQTANADDMEAQLADLRARIAAREKSTSDADDRILVSLRDSIATIEVRKQNIESAKHNAEFITAELDRIEQKIAALSEMAVNADPVSLSAQVDAVAEGITQTEATIRELQSITGMAADQSTPAILVADVEG